MTVLIYKNNSSISGILTKIGLKNVDSLIVSQPKYMTALESILKKIKWMTGSLYALVIIKQSFKSVNYQLILKTQTLSSMVLTGAVKQPSDERATSN
jgi:endothelin-converting enzyme/putative endopeptidase